MLTPNELLKIAADSSRYDAFRRELTDYYPNACYLVYFYPLSGTYALESFANPVWALSTFQKKSAFVWPAYREQPFCEQPYRVLGIVRNGVILAQLRDNSEPTALFHAAFVRVFRRDSEYWLRQSDTKISGLAVDRQTFAILGPVCPALINPDNCAPVSAHESQRLINRLNLQHDLHLHLIEQE